MVREGLPEEVAIALYSPDVQVETEREERATCAKALGWGVYISERRQPRARAERRGGQFRELGWVRDTWGLGSQAEGGKKMPLRAVRCRWWALHT